MKPTVGRYLQKYGEGGLWVASTIVMLVIVGVIGFFFIGGRS